MTIRAIRQSAVGLCHVNLTRDLPTRPSAFERLGTLKAEADPLAKIERDLQETRAIIAEFTKRLSAALRRYTVTWRPLAPMEKPEAQRSDGSWTPARQRAERGG